MSHWGLHAVYHGHDKLSQHYSEALLDVSDEDKSVWWVFSIMANDYYVLSSTQYELFIDARSGEIIRFEVHAPKNSAD